MDINDDLYRTNQTFIVELGFLGVHSDEDHQIYLFWLFWALSTVLRLCFFRKVFLKSDTAVALRTSLTKVPCITLEFSSTFVISFSVN